MPYYDNEDEERVEEWKLQLHYTDEPRSRPSGLLTYDDREYLFGQKDLEEHVEAQSRQRLRDRIRNGLLDFELLLGCLDEQEIETIFSDMTPPPAPNQSRGIEVYDGAAFTIGFLYHAISTQTSVDFEEIVEKGIEQASSYREHTDSRGNRLTAEATVNIDVDWSVWEIDYDGAREKLRQGEPLSDSEIAGLVRHADLTDEEWEALRSIPDE
ncbi:hypothetical protein ACERIM_10755 [Natrinema sp. H-ect1]|uniref:hypothetical protein n=1 Tax=Natrinema sp. H-ect1 TaxID=3242700 RepID=UPI00359CDF37